MHECEPAINLHEKLEHVAEDELGPSNVCSFRLSCSESVISVGATIFLVVRGKTSSICYIQVHGLRCSP